VNLSHEAVEAAVFGAVSDLNESLPAEKRVPLDAAVDIFGAVDSLGALNFLLRIEDRIGQASGLPCDLTESGLYEIAPFSSPSLGELVTLVHGAVNGTP
jgi:hypothetical protein